MNKNKAKFIKRSYRVRAAIRQKAKDKLRLSVFRSGCHIYAQIIDDMKGITIASASTRDKTLAKELKKGWNSEAAKEVGNLIGKRALKANVKEVVFDRGGYLYNGRVKALAEAAREVGLKF